MAARLQPADFFLVSTRGEIARSIEVAEFIADHFRRSPWTHAGIVTEVTAGGSPKTIVEAEPHGTTETAWHYDGYQVAFSAGRFDLTASQRNTIVLTAERLAEEKIGYAFADYGALALHALRIPAPGLRDFIADSGHMICSQEVDYCYQQAGCHLFDGRWNGYVMPSSLGFLL